MTTAVEDAGTAAPRRTSAPGSRRIAIGIALVLGVMVALNLLARGLDDTVGGGEPQGEAGSSYATTPAGLSAFSTLVRQYGHPVRALRGDLADAGLDPAATLVFADAPLSPADASAISQFLVDGGRAVVAGLDTAELRRLRDDPPTFGGNDVTTFTDIDATLPGIRAVRTAGDGVWTDPGSGRVLVSAGPAAGLLVSERVGRGELLTLADSAPLQNEYLDQADNAAFAIALAGEAGRPVAFAEGAHGIDRRRGLSAIPTRWKLALLGLAGAALVLMWARGRRFGPPDLPNRELPPPRARYVEALSTTLERTHQPGPALAGVQQHARDRIAARAALPKDASREDIDRAARALGFNEAELEALWVPPATASDVLALGDASARIANAERGKPA